MILNEIICETMVNVDLEAIIQNSRQEGILGTLISAGFKGYGAYRANKAAKRERAEKVEAMAELKDMEKKRQVIINPYLGVVSLEDSISNVSSMASNPFSNLAVSTAAAEMQIEQSDLALANTLDTLRASGASAGGATALARMALESKRGVAAGIEQQEAANQKMAAGGEERLQNVRMDEAVRVQDEMMGEKSRIQEADVKGKVYEFETREGRQQQQLDRKQAQITNSAMAESSYTRSTIQGINSAADTLGDGLKALG